MTTYIIRRCLWGILVLFLVSLIVFFSLRLIPGDPVLIYAAQMASGGSGVSEEQLDKLRVEYGLDKSVPVQYVNWLKGLVQGDLGKSIKYNQDVGKLLGERFQPTLVLGFTAVVLSTLLGVLFGLIAAVRRGTWIDTIVTFFSYVGLCIPVFMLAILLVYVFGLKLGWLPITGYDLPWKDFGASVRKGIMPIICLAMVPLAVTARQMRSSVLEVNNMDYVRTAWSKGLREKVVVTRHVLKNSLIPVVTMLGISVGLIFGGSVIIETMYGIPGVGWLLVTSIFGRDYVVIQGGTLVIAAIVIFVNLIVDISYGWFDPRIRYG
jgi:peptide/nickel transport system permease protein